MINFSGIFREMLLDDSKDLVGFQINTLLHFKEVSDILDMAALNCAKNAVPCMKSNTIYYYVLNNQNYLLYGIKFENFLILSMGTINRRNLPSDRLIVIDISQKFDYDKVIFNDWSTTIGHSRATLIYYLNNFDRPKKGDKNYDPWKFLRLAYHKISTFALHEPKKLLSFIMQLERPSQSALITASAGLPTLGKRR